jgi:hypothetical protein
MQLRQADRVRGTHWNNGDYSDLILTKRLFYGYGGTATKA